MQTYTTSAQPSVESQSHSRRSFLPPWLPIAMILLLACGLYLYQLGDKSLWLDELISVEDVKTGEGLPPHNLVRPLYFLFLTPWLKLGGTGDAWLRGLSVIFAIGSVYFLYHLGWHLVGKTEGLLAALLLALSPLFIRHAQEVRMYTLSTCLGIAGTLVLVYALENPRPRRVWGWAMLRFLALLTTPLNACLFLPDVGIIFGNFRRDRPILGKFALGLVGIGLLWLPFLVGTMMATVSYSTSGHVQSAVVPGIEEFIRQLRSFTVWPFYTQVNPIIALGYKLFTFGMWFVIAFTLIGKKQSGKIWWLAAWALLPLTQMFVASQFSFSIWVDRYLLLACPYILLLLGVGIVKIVVRWRLFGLIILLSYLLALAGGLNYHYHHQADNDSRGRDYRAMVEIINSNEQEGDVIVMSIRHQNPRLPLNHYYRGEAEIEFKSGVPAARNVTTAQIDGWLDSLPSTPSRLWLMCWLSPSNTELFNSLLQERFQMPIHQAFPTYKGKSTIDVFLVTPKIQQRLSRLENF